MDTAVPAEFVQLGVVAGESPMVPMAAGAVCPRGAGLALAERVGVIEIDLPDGVRVRVIRIAAAPTEPERAISSPALSP
jgi:hypothetical protein